ncbi:MAG: hypothetical protein LYZ66_04300 [Nitrososphaerales archaeon]|nr:hypothetical protein [Nitrososphaerales archaeon]
MPPKLRSQRCSSGSERVEFAKPIGEEEWGWYAHFRDPEGNRLQTCQPKPCR